MFGLGMPEILLILAIALIVIGPKKLPELAKTLGRAMGEFKRSAQDFKRSIDIETTVGDVTPPPATDLKKVVKEANEKADAPEAKQDAGADMSPPAEDSDTEASPASGTPEPPSEEETETPPSKN